MQGAPGSKMFAGPVSGVSRTDATFGTAMTNIMMSMVPRTDTFTKVTWVGYDRDADTIHMVATAS